MVDFGLEASHVVVHSVLLPGNLGFEYFDVPLLELEQLGETGRVHLGVLQHLL